MKRLLDLIFSLVALVILAPLMAAVALAIACTSPGGALFKQTRIGKGCKPFTIYKFRSMVADAPNQGSFRTATDDPRITKIGRFVRKTSIDELPQFFNVLKGDMSLVGPRPDTPKQEADYTPEEWQTRHQVRPGITGLAQATLRSSATPAERLGLDIEYARHSNLLLDIRVVFMTLKQVLGKGGN